MDQLRCGKKRRSRYAWRLTSSWTPCGVTIPSLPLFQRWAGLKVGGAPLGKAWRQLGMKEWVEWESVFRVRKWTKRKESTGRRNTTWAQRSRHVNYSGKCKISMESLSTFQPRRADKDGRGDVWEVELARFLVHAPACSREEARSCVWNLRKTATIFCS